MYSWAGGLPGPSGEFANEGQRLRYLRDIGWLGESKGVLCYADPIKDPLARPCGEGPNGIEVREHPEAMLLDDPDLWGPIEMFRDGHRRERQLDEWDHCSAFEVEVWEIARSVIHRIQTRGVRDA